MDTLDLSDLDPSRAAPFYPEQQYNFLKYSLKDKLFERNDGELREVVNEKRPELRGISDLEKLCRNDEANAASFSHSQCTRDNKGNPGVRELRWAHSQFSHEVESRIARGTMPIAKPDKRRITYYSVPGTPFVPREPFKKIG